MTTQKGSLQIKFPCPNSNDFLELAKKVSTLPLSENTFVKKVMEDFLNNANSILPIATTDLIYRCIENGCADKKYISLVTLWTKELIWNCQQVEAVPYLIAKHEHFDELNNIDFYDYDVIKTYQDLYAYKVVSILDKSLQLVNTTLRLNIKPKKINLWIVSNKLTKQDEILESLNCIKELAVGINSYRNAVTHRYSDVSKQRSILENLEAMVKIDKDEYALNISKKFRRINYSQYRHNLLTYHTEYASSIFRQVDSLFSLLNKEYEKACDS